MHRQDVGVSLHHKHAVFLGYGFLCLVYAVEFAVFVVDFRVGRVDVLLVYSFGARVEQTTSKSHNLSADANPRKYHTSGISVYQLAPVVLVADACLQYKLFLVSLSQSLGGKGTAVLQVVAQLKLLDDVVSESTATEVLHANGYAVGIVLHLVLEVLHSPLVDNEHTLALALLTLLVVGKLALLYLYMILLGKPAQRFGIRHLLVLHYEANRIASLATSKAVAHATTWRHVERRRLLVVERTQALIVCSAAAQRNKLGHYLYDIGGILDSFYCCVIYHCLFFRYSAKMRAALSTFAAHGRFL